MKKALCLALMIVPSVSSGACSSSDDAPATAAGSKLCLISDQKGDADDKTYVTTARQGGDAAAAKFNWTATFTDPGTTDFSKIADAYEGKVDALAKEGGCGLIVTIAPLFDKQTFAVAERYPSQKFLVLDAQTSPGMPNIWAQTYAVDEAAFLAGYVAAATTETGKIGVFGGMSFPSIHEFMDGYALGAEYFNESHPERVATVVGWDVAKRQGDFLGENGFTDPSLAEAKAKEFLGQDVDIIFPVAGGAGFGVVTALSTAGKGHVIGVDRDWGEITENGQTPYRQYTVTTVLKKLNISILDALTAVVENTFEGGDYRGNLATGEVGLGGYWVDGLVSDALQAEVTALEQEIKAGEVKTKP